MIQIWDLMPLLFLKMYYDESETEQCYTWKPKPRYNLLSFWAQLFSLETGKRKITVWVEKADFVLFVPDSHG